MTKCQKNGKYALVSTFAQEKSGKKLQVKYMLSKKLLQPGNCQKNDIDTLCEAWTLKLITLLV